MKSSVQMLDGVLPVDRLDRQERPEDALLVGTANFSPTMPARRCANSKPLVVSEFADLQWGRMRSWSTRNWYAK